MNLLLVDDDPKFRSYMQQGLQESGMHIETAESGEQASRLLEQRGPGGFDLLLLDVMLPGSSGWDVLERLRQRGDPTPVIFLTARSAVEERVKGLRLGADDYGEEWWASSELTGGFTQMEANFSLFFGLAIMLYESTLVPDQAPYDLFAGGDEFALSEEAKRGLGIFLGKGKCSDCHATPLFAGNVAIDVLSHSDPAEGEGILERMDMGNALSFGRLVLSTSPGTGELPLAFNPYRRTVVLVRNGQVLARARTPAGSRCPPAGEILVPFVPTAFVPVQSEFRATLRLRPDGLCGLDVDLDVEWNELGPPGGPLAVAFGGGNRFFIDMPAPSRRAVYDNGFYNIGVRPSAEDLGVGANGPFGPLAHTRRVQAGEDLGFESSGVGVVGLGERIAVNGAFKTPTLRNIELTGPYMHNGGMATLRQVVEFYTRATDFGDVNSRDLDPDVGGIAAMTEQDVEDMVAFLESLTDPRVRFEQAPFDHPELPLKTGVEGDHLAVTDDGTGNAIPLIELVPATGSAGGPPIPSFEDTLPATITVAPVQQGRRALR